MGIRQDLEQHRGRCDGQVVGIGVNTFDHERLRIAELDALPVLAWDEVEPGRVRLLCDQCCVLFKDVDGADDLAEHWRDRPATA